LLPDEALRLLNAEIRKKRLRWAITSHAIRRLQPGAAPTVTPAWLKAVWAHEKLPRPHEQANIFLQYLAGDDVASGDFISCKPLSMTAVLGTADDPKRQETYGFAYVVNGLKEGA
jgi:hypothetical protein